MLKQVDLLNEQTTCIIRYTKIIITTIMPKAIPGTRFPCLLLHVCRPDLQYACSMLLRVCPAA